VDPDPGGPKTCGSGTPVVWIRIRIDFDGQPDPQLIMRIMIQEEKITSKIGKKGRNLMY
jgi:hypothetical protein